VRIEVTRIFRTILTPKFNSETYILSHSL